MHVPCDGAGKSNYAAVGERASSEEKESESDHTFEPVVPWARAFVLRLRSGRTESLSTDCGSRDARDAVAEPCSRRGVQNWLS